MDLCFNCWRLGYGYKACHVQIIGEITEEEKKCRIHALGPWMNTSRRNVHAIQPPGGESGRKGDLEKPMRLTIPRSNHALLPQHNPPGC